MKSILLFLSVVLFSAMTCTAQERAANRFYFYWGYNWSWYPESSLTFTGEDYNFTLDNVSARDRQSRFTFDNYFNPNNFSLPQVNYKLGYLVGDKWDFSVGVDHMKYVVIGGQQVVVSGNIANSQTRFDGVYDNYEMELALDFLRIEHTDGLNNVTAEGRRMLPLWMTRRFSVLAMGGMGLGAMLPRTNATLFGKERHDAYHLSGYAVSSMAGVHLRFFETIFLKAEGKAGYINMPDVRTTESPSDRAEQEFTYAQINVGLGWIVNWKSSKPPKTPKS